MSTIQELNQRFGLADKLVFTTTESGMPVARINTALCQAAMTLQGAQVYSWIPSGEREVIWTSTQAKFAPGKSLRGGVPICWPWFGPHAERKELPAHGFARTVNWTVKDSRLLSDGRVFIGFELNLDSAMREMWPHACQAELQITLGSALELALITTNSGQQVFELGEALHTYFNVGDIRQVNISGLEDTTYLDKVDAFARKQQSGSITIDQEVDRVYLDTEQECVIHDASLQRRIHIRKQGSRSTVVWNPWQAKADAMGDMGDAGYLHMLCVESANAAENVVSVAPGKAHSMTVTYFVEKAN